MLSPLYKEIVTQLTSCGVIDYRGHPPLSLRYQEPATRHPAPGPPGILRRTPLFVCYVDRRCGGRGVRYSVCQREGSKEYEVMRIELYVRTETLIQGQSESGPVLLGRLNSI